MFNNNRVVSVVGLGYVGLSVALAFGKVRHTVGFDIDSERVSELKKNYDRTHECTHDVLSDTKVIFTDLVEELANANFHIIAVPTPIDDANQPDLTPLLRASETVGSILKKGDIIVYESTVYPGVTEEECAPVLERVSGLVCGKDFKLGYSPERVNPGDKLHTFTKIKKVISGQDEETLDIVASVYESAVTAGVYRAESIKVAEAAKAIENTQRDLNIALMNELAIIFNILNLDTKSVLEAAGTKWNFLNFNPGLVGGHCIGVDPYYLTHKAEISGYIPQVILAGRRINDSMGRYIAQCAVKELIRCDKDFHNNNVTILGLTFKENCGDIRNSKVVDIINELREFNLDVQVSDPLANQDEVSRLYGIELIPMTELKQANMVIVAVAHDIFRDMSISDLNTLMKPNPVLIDVKGIYDPASAEQAGIRFWRL